MHSKRMYSFKTIGPNCYIDIRHKTYIDRILSTVLWNIKNKIFFFTNWSVCVCVLRPVGYKSSSCCDVRNLFFYSINLRQGTVNSHKLLEREWGQCVNSQKKGAHRKGQNTERKKQVYHFLHSKIGSLNCTFICIKI